MAVRCGEKTTVDIWIIGPDSKNTDPAPGERESLSQKELTQASRFRFERDTRRFLARRRALRRILSRYVEQPPEDLNFATNPFGKPGLILPGGNTWAFNLSHSQDLAVLAVTRGLELGIDVEYALKPVPDLFEVLRVVCRPVEVQQLLSLPDAWHQSTFFRLWTFKEAYLKALGTGLSKEADSVHVRISGEEKDVRVSLEPHEEKDWQTSVFEPHPGYISTLAVKTQKRLDICYYSFQVSGARGR